MFDGDWEAGRAISRPFPCSGQRERGAIRPAPTRGRQGQLHPERPVLRSPIPCSKLNGGRHCCRPPLHHRLPIPFGQSGNWQGARTHPKTRGAPAPDRLATIRNLIRSRPKAGAGSAGPAPPEGGEADLPEHLPSLDGWIETPSRCLCGEIASEEAKSLRPASGPNGQRVASPRSSPLDRNSIKPLISQGLSLFS